MKVLTLNRNGTTRKNFDICLINLITRTSPSEPFMPSLDSGSYLNRYRYRHFKKLALILCSVHIMSTPAMCDCRKSHVNRLNGRS